MPHLLSSSCQPWSRLVGHRSAAVRPCSLKSSLFVISSEYCIARYVESVELQLEAGEVHIRLGHQQGIEWPCPECGLVCPLYDHQPERQWRHLDTCRTRPVNPSSMESRVRAD